MLNNVVLVGRLANDLEVYKTESGRSIMTMILAVPKPFKNADGFYESDFIECTLWQGIAENTAEYVKKGDLIGVKGHLSSYKKETEDQTTYKNEFVVERVTFLASTKEKSN